jgi:hemerythrin
MAESYAPLIWCEQYVTGVDEIDEQHQILVHTLNEAGQRLGQGYSVSLLEQITQDLLSYALYHFDTEEELMQHYGYQAEGEAMSRHLQQHRSFSERVVAVREGLKAEQPIAAEDLLAFLNQWLVNHILNTDKHLAAFILARRAAT